MNALSRLLILPVAAVASLSPAAESSRPDSNGFDFVSALADQKGAAAKAKPAKTATGTFIGIEEGDYAHWQMRDESGKELSFFILNPDASVDKVLENPKKFAGRKCRVKWKQSTENLPEAGGDTKIEQILSVEWVEK